MIKIPVLQKTSYKYEEIFLDEFEPYKKEFFFDMVIDRYPNKILDIYDHRLNLDSNELNNLDSEYFRLNNEYKYLNFITDVFLLNEKKSYIKINLRRLDGTSILDILGRLDVIDKHIILHQIELLKDGSNKYFIITNINLLKMFMKGILRELFDVEIYFAKKPLLLFSNYDLSLPIVFKNINDLAYYENIAERNNLYFR